LYSRSIFSKTANKSIVIYLLITTFINKEVIMLKLTPPDT